MAANKPRGEIAFTVQGVELVMCVEMERLAKFEEALGVAWGEAYNMLCVQASTRAILAALRTLVIKGDWQDAIKRLNADWTGDDIIAIQTAALEAFTAHTSKDDEPGKK